MIKHHPFLRDPNSSPNLRIVMGTYILCVSVMEGHPEPSLTIMTVDAMKVFIQVR